MCALIIELSETAVKFDLIYLCCGPNFVTFWNLRGLLEGAKCRPGDRKRRTLCVCCQLITVAPLREERKLNCWVTRNESYWQTNCENCRCPYCPPPPPTVPFLGLCLCTEACVILVFDSVNPRSFFQNINKPAIGKRVQYSFLSYRPCYLNLYFIDHLYADRAFLAKVHWTAFKTPFHPLASFGKHWFLGGRPSSGGFLSARSLHQWQNGILKEKKKAPHAGDTRVKRKKENVLKSGILVCAWPAWNKHIGTCGLVTVYTTEHKVSISFQTAANVHLAQKWKREYAEIQVVPCFTASEHIKMNLNAKKQTLCGVRRQLEVRGL